MNYLKLFWNAKRILELFTKAYDELHVQNPDYNKVVAYLTVIAAIFGIKSK